jgi:hypothetical protein
MAPGCVWGKHALAGIVIAEKAADLIKAAARGQGSDAVHNIHVRDERPAEFTESLGIA